MLRVFFYTFICSLMISGCTTINPEDEVFYDEFEAEHYASTEYNILTHTYTEPERSGIYHTVKPGETLWRIAKTYNVALDDIIRSNSMPDAARIEKNQLVFIPGAYEVLDVTVAEDEDSNAFVWPVEGKVIRFFNQPFRNRINKGIHIQAQAGDVVKAARSGKVVFADYLPGYAYTVIIDHKDGFYSVYAQNAKLLVDNGKSVTKRAPIAYVASDSRLAYLDFQIRRNSIEDNPLHYLP